MLRFILLFIFTISPSLSLAETDDTLSTDITQNFEAFLADIRIKAINTITNYRKPISAAHTRTKTCHKHRGICCLLSLVKTCLMSVYCTVSLVLNK
jgi:hypothetical protein